MIVKVLRLIFVEFHLLSHWDLAFDSKRFGATWKFCSLDLWSISAL